MARIFISHSSADNALAIALSGWLTEQGWDDLFLDLDSVRGIAAGERWARKLHEAADRCEAVLFLVSRSWLGSSWCRTEFHLAQKLSKRTFGILVEDLPTSDLPPELTDHWQFVSLAAGTDHRIFRVTLPDGTETHCTLSNGGLARLRAGLQKAGLDARFFAWPPTNEPARPPYRGLKPLERDDAGIFFGREAPMIGALDRLRGLVDSGRPRILVILGASGSGKSSFLRAGLIPRLERDDRAFVVLPIVRPQRAAISGETGLVRALEDAARMARLQRSRATVSAAIESGAGSIVSFLAEIGAALAPADDDRSARRPPALVLAIDQAEELFASEGAAEGTAFITLVRAIADDDRANVVLLFTIRSDSFDQLQTAPGLEGVNVATFGLPPMPRGAYQTIIEGPAGRLAESDRALAIEPALTDALLADIEAGGGKDALPLLAFTLERLYVEHGGDGDLRLDEYRALGGIAGSIEAAVEAALASSDRDPAVPQDRGARLSLLRRALIPWLAGIDPETGAPRRRIARLSEIPEEARPLVDHLVAARLLATDVSLATGERTIEPAHEALLRQWGLLQGWLAEDFAALSSVEGVKRSSRDWAANDRDAEWLAHQAGRLEDAESLRDTETFARYFDATDLAYLAACRARETSNRDRELAEARRLAEVEREVAERQRQVTHRTRIGLVAASLLAIAAAALGWYGIEQARLAAAKTAEAEAGSAQLTTTVANTLIDAGRIDEAALLLLDSAKVYSDGNAPDEALIALHRVNEAMALRQVYALPPGRAFQGFGELYFSDDAKGDVLRFDGSGPLQVVATAVPARVVDLMPSFDGEFLTMLLEDGSVASGDASGAVTLAGRIAAPPEQDGRVYSETAIELSPDGIVLASSSFYSTTIDERGSFIRMIDARTGISAEGVIDITNGAAEYLTSNDGAYIAETQGSGVYRVERSADTIEFVKSTNADLGSARFRRCLIAGRHKPVSLTVPTPIAEGFDFPGAYDHRCMRLDDGFVWYSFVQPTSAGGDEIDYIVSPEGETASVAELINNLANRDVSSKWLTWIGADEGLRGVVFDRELLVFTEYGVSLQRKYAETPGPAVFLRGKLAVVERVANRLNVYSLEYSTPRSAISAAAGARPAIPLNKGTCVGYAASDDIARRFTLPDNAAVTLGGATMTSGSEPPEVLIEGAGASRRIVFGTEEGCMQFSADWKRVVLVNDDGQVNIFDFDRLRQSANLDEAWLDTLPGTFTTAFPVGDAGDLIVAGGDAGRGVYRWSKDSLSGAWAQELIFDGDDYSFYAEPDETGEKLIVLQSRGSGSVGGLLYSVPAAQTWIELGSDYKWFGAMFGEDKLIAWGSSQGLQRFIRLPDFSVLAMRADEGLAPGCRPLQPGAYSTSPCWPTWLSN